MKYRVTVVQADRGHYKWRAYAYTSLLRELLHLDCWYEGSNESPEDAKNKLIKHLKEEQQTLAERQSCVKMEPIKSKIEI